MVNKKILFPKEYPYTSSTTKILRENFKELYKECRKLINISKKDLVVDIGSNDGNLLSNFKDHHKVLGITPEKIGKFSPGSHIPIVDMSHFQKFAPDVAYLFAWNHKDEIFKKEKNYNGKWFSHVTL